MQYFGKIKDEMFPAPGELGGHAEGISIARLMTPEIGDNYQVRMVCIQLQPGGHVSPHTHYFDQVYFSVNGELEVTVAGNVYRMSPGAYAVIPAGTVHSSRNVGKASERHLEIMGGPRDPSKKAFEPAD